MALKTSSVSKSLDKKLKVAGFEIPDLLLIFLLLALLNFIFSGHSYKLLLSWLPSALLAVSIRWGKRGKPDNYILHLIKFKFSPRYLSAFKEATNVPELSRSSKPSVSHTTEGINK